MHLTLIPFFHSVLRLLFRFYFAHNFQFSVVIQNLEPSSAGKRNLPKIADPRWKTDLSSRMKSRRSAVDLHTRAYAVKVNCKIPDKASTYLLFSISSFTFSTTRITTTTSASLPRSRSRQQQEAAVDGWRSISPTCVLFCYILLRLLLQPASQPSIHKLCSPYRICGGSEGASR